MMNIVVLHAHNSCMLCMSDWTLPVPSPSASLSYFCLFLAVDWLCYKT